MPLSCVTALSSCVEKREVKMKQKWLDCPPSYRVMILIQAFLIVLFSLLYCTVGHQQFVRYDGECLRYRKSGDVITYTGQISDQPATITVSPGPVVEYDIGGTQYGPYVITDDPTAVPALEDLPPYYTGTQSLHGIELRHGDQVLFRGCYGYFIQDLFKLYSEDGSDVPSGKTTLQAEPGINFSTNYVTVTEQPNVKDILTIALDPQPDARCEPMFFVFATLLAIGCALSILYVEDLFRFNLRFVIADPERAEPSEWELFSRWVGWICGTGVVIGFFIIGLTNH